jgi:hypothetical protein
MPTITMKIAEIVPPKPGKQRGWVKGADGSKLGCFFDKFGLFELGQTYDVEYTETSSGGCLYQNVKSASLIISTARSAPAPVVPMVAPAPAPRPAPPAPASFAGDFNRQTHPVDSRRMFVCANLVAFIRAGKIELEPKQLANATDMLCRLHDWAFKSDNEQVQPRQARG